jgi:5'-nucleotidase
MPTILVTNDDGISSPGIKILSKTLKSIGDVYVVAPETEQSAVAHALTLHRPLRFKKVGSKTYYVNGTPTDCVIIGVNKILPHRPDIIVSGINNGANLGDDISYSGTVAAAIEGTFLGVPSIAVSSVRDSQNNNNSRKDALKFQVAANFARDIALKVINRGLPENTLLNVNVPNCAKINGVRITKQGKLVYDNSVQELRDPRGNEYYWVGGGIPQWESGENTDFGAVQDGYISVTPVHLDLTNHEAIKYLEENWKI